ncbi:hypothetical protein AB0B50_01645 [Streptomyces sp. NPDC041068]|uniref:hypothetical protein n=1 Tax=Streptomyces sp. NPDC041068 TaxID=3155130 RepID=UPI0033C9931B
MTTDDAKLRAEIGRLALDDLPAHLSAAGRVDRLLRLFHDDRRLRRRVTTETRLWDGYQSDIDIAWGAVDRALREDPARIPDPLAGYIQLALLRSSVTAADDIPSRLVVAAVATGYWSATRALSTIGRAASPGEQADGYYRLLALAPLTESTRKTVQAQVVALAALPGDEVPARALLDGITLLDAPARTAVAAGLEDTARVVGWQMPARLSWKRHRPQGLEASETVALLCAAPEIRRPRLVARVADALIDDLAELNGREAQEGQEDEAQGEEARGEEGEAETLLAQLERDSAASLIDPAHRLLRTGHALVELAPLLAGHPDGERLVHRLDALVAGVRDAETRSRLVDAYGLTLPEDTQEGPDASGSPAGQGSRRARRWALVRDVSRRLTRPLPEPASSRTPSGVDERESEEESARAETLDALTRQWFVEGAPSRDVPHPTEHHKEYEEPEPEAEEGPQDQEEQSEEPQHKVAPPDEEGARYQEFRDFTRRAGGPALIASLLTAQHLPDDTLGAMVEAVYLSRELPGQMALVETLTQHPELVDATAAVRKVKGHLLRCALSQAPVSPQSAWEGLSADQLRDVDFRPVLDFALTLPAEQRRSAFWHTAMGHGVPLEVRTVPRLAALALLLPHLDAPQVAEAFDDVLALEDSEVRLLGLDLLGPYLGAEQVARAIASLRVAPDAREMTWLLGEFVALLDPADEARADLEERVAAGLSHVDAGADLAVAVLRRLQRADRELDAAHLGGETVSRLDRMDPNNRLDALLVLLNGTEGAITPDLAARIIGLPVVNDLATYSWRGLALAAAAARFADDWIPAAWYAAQDLPRRLTIGDSPAWGWSWEYEYPYAAAVEALAPRLRGPLARQAFEAAKEMPWEPRERITRLLAEHADDALSHDLFDHAVAVHRSYQGLPDAAEPPFPLEGTVVTEPLVTFKGLREVQLAELIAAVVTRLDDGRMAEAVELACTFANSGPRSWLPAKLLPALPGFPALAAERRDRLVASGTVGALEFIAIETERLDLLADLLPHLREVTDERARPAREFVMSRFPRHGRGFLLDADEHASLGAQETAEYHRLLGIEDRAEIEGGLSRGDDEEKRQFLVRVVLRPFFAGALEQSLVELLVGASAVARARVLEATAGILEPENHRAIVDHTLAQLLGEPMDHTERLEGLALILPTLTPAQRDGLVDAATHPDSPGLPDDQGVSHKVFALLLDDVRALEDTDRWFSPVRHNRYAHAFTSRMRENRLKETFALVHGERAAFLTALAPHLTGTAARRLATRVEELPDLERADVSAALLPLFSGEDRAALVAGIRGLTDPFARFWALFVAQEHLTPADASPPWADFVHAAAMAFEDPADACACLCLLIGYAEPDTARKWRTWVISRLGGLGDEDALRVTAGLAAALPEDRDLGKALVDAVCSRTTDEAVHAGVLVLARHGIAVADLAGPHRTSLHALLSRRLRGLADRGRRDLLSALAAEAPLIGALTTRPELSSIARGVHEVCLTWRWP